MFRWREQDNRYVIHNLGPTKTTTPNWTPGSIVKITTKTVTEMGKDDRIELRICGSESCPDPKYDIFLTFPACFLKSQYFFPIWILNFLIHMIWLIWETSRNKLKRPPVTKNCSDLSLFEQIVLVISKILQILGLQPPASNFNFFFLDP